MWYFRFCLAHLNKSNNHVLLRSLLVFLDCFCFVLLPWSVVHCTADLIADHASGFCICSLILYLYSHLCSLHASFAVRILNLSIQIWPDSRRKTESNWYTSSNFSSNLYTEWLIATSTCSKELNIKHTRKKWKTYFE